MPYKQLLLTQTTASHNWTNKLLNSVPSEKWEFTKPELGTTIQWQAGHLVVSEYYHAVYVIKGLQQDLRENIDLRSYSDIFATGTRSLTEQDDFNRDRLMSDLKVIQKKVISIMENLASEEFNLPLVEGKYPHPTAKTKVEALSWNIQHTMWHCGQIAMIKRIIDKPYDYNLPWNN